MSAFKLVQLFEDRTHFPVHLNEVRDSVARLHGADGITFKAVDIDKDILRGICLHWQPLPRPYAEPEAHIEVLYAEDLEPEWQRLVITKELIHVLDKQEHRIENEAQLDDLVRRMARRPELRDPMNWREMSDRVGLYQALGVLFPKAARDLIKDKYDQDRISDEMIAHRAGLPLEFVSFVMSDDWDEYYGGLMQFCELEAEAA